MQCPQKDYPDIEDSINAACEQVDFAVQTLEARWNAFKEDRKWDLHVAAVHARVQRDPHARKEVVRYFSDVVFVGNNRAFYLDSLKKAQSGCQINRGVKILCDTTCGNDAGFDSEGNYHPEVGNGRLAYTIFRGKNFYLFQTLHPIQEIYLCNSFFGADNTSFPKIRQLVHEFGRMYGAIQGETELDRTNIYVWDAVVAALASFSKPGSQPLTEAFTAPQ